MEEKVFTCVSCGKNKLRINVWLVTMGDAKVPLCRACRPEYPIEHGAKELERIATALERIAGALENPPPQLGPDHFLVAGGD